MATYYDVFQLKEHIAPSALNDPKILGIGVGCAAPGNPKSGPCLYFYTHKKVPSSLSLPKVLSAKVNGRILSAPVKVIKTSPFKANAQAPSSVFRRRVRPVPAGFSVGLPDLSGTVGLIVINFPQGNQLYVCSNNHVLNKNNTSGFSVTVQPGGADGGHSPRDRIGRLDRFVRLKKTNNFLDAATSIPLSNSLLSPTYATVGALPGHVASYRVGELFCKVGRTTGPVLGRVDAINVDLKVDYSQIYPQLGVIQFRNQSVIVGRKPVSLAGDSGSVWLRNRDKFAAAINFAGTVDGLRSISYPVQWFMQVFRTRVAAPGGGAATALASNRSLGYGYTKPLSPGELKKIPLVKGCPKPGCSTLTAESPAKTP
ncbi:MAG: hypothetical protein ACYDG6_01290 [Thermincolia bacterium]